MGDDADFRRELAAAAILLVLGAVGLAAGVQPLAGWGLVVFGLVGLAVAVGRRRGRTPERRTTPEPRPTPGPRRTAPDPPLRPVPPLRSVPPLSAGGQARLAEIVAVLHAEGVLAPDAPDPAHLHEPVADYGEPVTVDGVLLALGEASYYHPDHAPERYAANIVLHATQVEQLRDYLLEQIDDIVRLSGGALTVDVINLQQEFVDGSRGVPIRIRWSVNGTEDVLEYSGAAKYLSTVIHVALTRAAAGASAPLAGLWSDQGLWLTAVPDVERLNAALGLDADRDSVWEWVAEQEPMAAGDI